MIAANRMLLACLSTGALLAMYQADAADDVFERQVEQMTDLVLETLPMGQVFDRWAAASAHWPLNEQLAKQQPAGLACLRAEMTSAKVRESKLSKVREYALADRTRFAADLALLNTGAGKFFGDYFLRLTGPLQAGGTPIDFDQALKEAPQEKLRNLSTLVLEEQYQPLRQLIGLSDFLKGGSPEATQTLMAPFVQGVLTCNVSIDGAALEPPPTVTEMTFAAQCNSAVEIPRNAKLTAPHSDPTRPLQQPEYPAWSRRRGEEGKTILDVYVTEEGRVAKAQVHTSSGFPVLDSEAVKNAGNWQFVPGKLHGQPVCMWGRFATSFKLTD